jgi:hypothetical protein
MGGVALILGRGRRLLGRSGEAAALAHRVTADPARAEFVTQVWATRTRRSRERLAGTRIDMLHTGVLVDPPPGGR